MDRDVSAKAASTQQKEVAKTRDSDTVTDSETCSNENIETEVVTDFMPDL